MSELKGKIDFTLFISAWNANPNGDPLNGNRPRINLDGHGEISDVCIKRKIRNRLQDLGQKIFVQSDERSDDGYTSLKDRADGCKELKEQMDNKKNAKPVPQLHVKNGWMCGHLVRCLRLREFRFLLVCEDRFRFIRQ